jgi:hypothetical protein
MYLCMSSCFWAHLLCSEVSVYMWACMCVSVCLHALVFMYVFMYAQLLLGAFTLLRGTCIHVGVHVCKRMLACTCIYVCIYVCPAACGRIYSAPKYLYTCVHVCV